MTEKKPVAIYCVWGLVLLLIVLQQDYWLWNNDYAVFGFLPIGLFFHICISIAASITWLLATKYAWPHELDYIEPVSTRTDAIVADSASSPSDGAGS